jgi:hypothetical protein
MAKTIKVFVIAIISLVMASCAGKQGNNVDDVVKITPSFTDSVHQYDELYPFSEGLAAVKKNDKFGFINTKGELVIPCQYQYAGQFKEGLACVVKDEENNNISFIDATGKMLHTKFPFNSYYYLGTMGQTYIGPAISFTNGVCEIKYTLGDNIGEEPQTVYIDRQMKEVAQPCEEPTQPEENLGYEIFSVSDKDIYGEETNLVGVKDKDGKIVIPAKYHDLVICDNGVVLARMFIENAESRFHHDKIGYGLTVYGYIDFTGKSTFTDADMGKLEGYKEAQIPAMAQLKLEAEQEERQAQYEEEQIQQENNNASNQNTSGNEAQILYQLQQLGERGRMMMPRIEALYRRQQQAQRQGILSNPQAQFDLNDAINELLDIKNEQIRLAEKLGDPQLVQEYKEQRSKVYRAKDQMLYGR